MSIQLGLLDLSLNENDRANASACGSLGSGLGARGAEALHTAQTARRTVVEHLIPHPPSQFPSGTRTARGFTPGFGKSFSAAENIAASTRPSPTALPSWPARAS